MNRSRGFCDYCFNGADKQLEKFAALTEDQTKDSGVLYASQRSTLARSVSITFVDLIQRVRGTVNAGFHKST